jgi:hypothetical protein
MYKIFAAIRCRELPRVQSKLFLIMKLSVFLCLISILQVGAATTYAQKISMNKSNASLSEALKEIHRQTGYKPASCTCCKVLFADVNGQLIGYCRFNNLF